MKKIFFDLYEDGELAKDEEGQEYEDLADAKRDAESSLHEMIAEDVKNERPLLPRMIKLLSENGTLIATVEIEGKVVMHQVVEN
jgi:uncharacterized protein DUF6894